MFFIHQCFQLLNWDFLEGSAIHKKDKPLKQRLKGWAKWILAGAALVSIPIGFISNFSNFMKILFTSNPLTDTGFLENLLLLVPEPIQSIIRNPYLILIGLGPLLTLLLKPMDYVEIWANQGLYDKIGSDWSIEDSNQRRKEYNTQFRLPPRDSEFANNLVLMTGLVLIIIGLSSLSPFFTTKVSFLNEAIWLVERMIEIIFLTNVVIALRSLDEERAIVHFAYHSKKNSRDLLKEMIYGESLVTDRDLALLEEWVKQLPEESNWGVGFYFIGLYYSTISTDLEEEQKQLSQEQQQTSIKKYTDAVIGKLVPSMYPTAWYNLGILLSDKGDIDQAEEAYRTAIKHKDDYADVWYNLGNLLKNRGDFDQAEEAYRTAIKHKDDDAFAWNNLGILLKNKGDIDQAEEAYRTAIKYKDDYADALYNLTCCYSLKNDVEKSIDNLTKAINLDRKLKEDARKDPDFDNIKDDPRFKQLVDDT